MPLGFRAPGLAALSRLRMRVNATFMLLGRVGK